MPKIRNRYFKLNLLIYFSLLLVVIGCASIQAPTGGPKDTTPPTIIEESPKNFTVNFKATEINITFDEYYKLNNEFKEISISPAVDKLPDFRIRKKTLNIRLQDTLASNTTYTINFGKAIGDYNENNILKNYVYVFSTGNKIDSLSISGKVTNAVTKQPELDATVFILPVSQDSLFGKRRAPIFTTTDSSGSFSLKYLRQDKYKIYALKEGEGGGDRIYNSASELVGFQGTPITLTKDTTDIFLQLFKQEPEVFRVADRKIENTGRILYVFNKQLEKPGIRILQPAELDQGKAVEFSRTNDTAYLWTPKVDFDSIQVAILNNDKSIDTTTIRRSKRDTYKQEIRLTDNATGGRIKPGTDLILTFSAPVESIDLKQVRLLQDSVPVSGFRISRDSLSTRKFIFKYSWRKDRQYILEIAENAVKGAFGGTNKAISQNYTRDTEENFGNLSVAVKVPDTTKSYVVEILNGSGNIIQSNPINKNATINYVMLGVGKYTIRVIYDENKNKKWDSGNIKQDKQPEDIWINDKEFTLRPNWDLEETITIPPPK